MRDAALQEEGRLQINVYDLLDSLLKWDGRPGVVASNLSSQAQDIREDGLLRENYYDVMMED